MFGLWPLLKPQSRGDGLSHAIAFYEAQKAELMRQLSAGDISTAEYDAADAEHARRLIAINRDRSAASNLRPGNARRRQKLAALVFLFIVPVLAFAMYFRIGQPNMPDQPLAIRKLDPRAVDLENALRKIEVHLAQNPTDGKGFELVAPIYMRIGRYEAAAAAYSRIVELLGETPARLSDLGESLVAAQNGVVSSQARIAFERSVVLEPEFAKSNFYLALAIEQDGDPARAYGKLAALANTLPDGPGRMRVMAELDRFKAEGKIPADAPKIQSDASELKKTGPESEAGRAIAAMPDQERAKMIRSMVDGLSARLGQSGGTLEEWSRLIQARMVLREPALAREHLSAARKQVASDPAALTALQSLAETLELSSDETSPVPAQKP